MRNDTPKSPNAPRPAVNRQPAQAIPASSPPIAAPEAEPPPAVGSDAVAGIVEDAAPPKPMRKGAKMKDNTKPAAKPSNPRPAGGGFKKKVVEK